MTDRTLAAPLFFLLLAAPAAAAVVGPTSQTLEALRGSAGSNDDGAKLFDGYGERVRSLAPVEYAPLPPAPVQPPAAPVTFDSRRVAPNVVLHAPAERAPRDASAGTKTAGWGAVGLGAAAAVAGLALGGGLLLPLAAVGLGLIVLGVVLLARS